MIARILDFCDYCVDYLSNNRIVNAISNPIVRVYERATYSAFKAITHMKFMVRCCCCFSIIPIYKHFWFPFTYVKEIEHWIEQDIVC